MSVQAKTARIDLRMSDSARKKIDYAASLKGESISHWALSNLLRDAERDIDAAHTIYLDNTDFAALCDILDGEIPEATQELLNRKYEWV